MTAEEEPILITDAALRLLDALDYEWWWERSHGLWFLRVVGPEKQQRMVLGPYVGKVGS